MILRSTKILIETEKSETWVLRIAGPAPPGREYCRRCGSESQMLDLNAAVTVSGRSARDLIREIEGDSLHSQQTDRGHLLICGNSLALIQTFVTAAEPNHYE